jgi:uncharacterized protein (TIGR00251 family)
MKIVETKEGCILDVSVKPRSREFKVALEADEIVIRSTKEPVEGKVNKELVKELSRLFHRQVELVSGFTSKDKKLFVKGARKSEVEDLLKHV